MGKDTYWYNDNEVSIVKKNDKCVQKKVNTSGQSQSSAETYNDEDTCINVEWSYEDDIKAQGYQRW
jgi:hypothetical protein